MRHIRFFGVFILAATVGSTSLANAERAWISSSQSQSPSSPIANASAPPAIQRASDGFFYVNANMGSGTSRFLIDTAASHVILSRAEAKNASVRPHPSKKEDIVTAAGKIAADWVIIDELTVQGHVLRHVEAAVPHRDPGVSLLGQSALIRFQSLRIEGDQLVFAK